MIKRCFDLVISFLSLLLLSPVIILVSLKVASNLGRPILFKQLRPGLDGKLFAMLKFRSMLDVVDCSNTHLEDSERLTPFGRKLRASSLDELPGLWNVLKGDMSLVGPRPLLIDYLTLYSKEQARRHHVKPGLTGWAQINGRNAISWEDKFKYDLWYVENQSFFLDLKILIMTVIKVFNKEGISAKEHETMPIFTGSNSNSGNKNEK